LSSNQKFRAIIDRNDLLKTKPNKTNRTTPTMKQLVQSTRLQLAFVGTLMLASCAQTIDPQYRATADELETMKQAQAAYTADGAMTGAVVGAATGAGLAALNGGDKNDIAKGAAVGGIAGGLGGGMLGFQKGDQEGKGKVTQKRSQKELEKEVLARTNSLKQEIKTQDKWLVKLRAQSAAGANPKSIQDNAKQMLKAASADASNTASDQQYKGVDGYLELVSLEKVKSRNIAAMQAIADGAPAKIN
jgi:hypothetical protein